MNQNRDRLQKAIAIVSNHGGSPWRCHPDIRYRNRLITQPEVDLYGRSGWKRYRPRWFSLPGAPRNYRGELPGDWPGEEKRRLMSTYKVCMCLENMNEPGYFTEKFVEAVVAGCIPVYRASADIRNSVLKGAIWFDPSDKANEGPKALAVALHANWELVLRQNENWLQSNSELHNSSLEAVFGKLSGILSQAATARSHVEGFC